MSFTRNLGRALGTVLVAVANAQAETSRQQQANSAEQREADKWEKRRQEAHDAIQRAVTRHHNQYDTGNTNRENKAIDLRREVDQNCRNRSDALMSYTEECITRFEKNGY